MATKTIHLRDRDFTVEDLDRVAATCAIPGSGLRETADLLRWAARTIRRLQQRACRNPREGTGTPRLGGTR